MSLNDTQKLVAGTLLVGASLLTGDATMITVAGGIGVNWASEGLAGLWDTRTLGLRQEEPLAKAYERAIVRAVADLRDQFRRDSSDHKKLLAFDMVANCADAIGAAQFPPTLEVATIQTSLATSLDRLLLDHDAEEVAYLQRYLLPAVARAFRDQLAKDDKAWRRYHGWLIEQLAAASLRAAATPSTSTSAVALPQIDAVLTVLADVSATQSRLETSTDRLEELIHHWQQVAANIPTGSTAVFDNTDMQAASVVQGSEAYSQSARADGGTATVTNINISGAALPPDILNILRGVIPASAANAPQFGRPADFLWVNVPNRPFQPLVGRDDMLNELVGRLIAGHSPALSTDGLPGVGKTALAIALAHDERICAHFSGVLWGGLGTAPNPAGIVNQWAAAIGVEVADLPGLAQRVERLCAYLGDRRVLVVLDDAWDSDSPAQLRLQGRNVVHLLTTRRSDIARAFAGAVQQVHVPELMPAPAFELLQQLAPEACAADPAAARDLANYAGGLPLAIELLGGYLAVPEHSLFPDLSAAAIKDLVDPQRRLALAQARLGDASGKQQSLYEVIQMSLNGLAAANPDTLDRFYALGAFAPKPARFDRVAAAAVALTDVKHLAALAQLNLMEVDKAGQITVHQVIADAARFKMPPEAQRRHEDYYRSLIDSNRDDWQLIQSIYEQARHAMQGLPKGDERIIPWVCALSVYWERRGLGLEQLSWAQQALAVAVNQGDVAMQGQILRDIGRVCFVSGDTQEALSHLEQALLLTRRGGDIACEGNILNRIGLIHNTLGDKQQALVYYEQALSVSRSAGDEHGEANALNDVGGLFCDLGEKQKALAYYEQALLLRRQARDKAGEAATLNNIGLVFSDLGDQQQSLAYYQQALPLIRQIGDKAGEATTLSNMGVVHSDLGDQRQALAHYEQALPLICQIGNKAGEAATLNNIGGVYSNLSDNHQALAHYEQALLLLRQVGDKRGEANTLNNIGGAYSSLGDDQQALAYFEQALPLVRQVGDKRGEAYTINNISSVYFHRGLRRQAFIYLGQALALACQIMDAFLERSVRLNIATLSMVQGNLRRAESEMTIVLSLDEKLTHPDLAADRAKLREMRAHLAQRNKAKDKERKKHK